MDAYLGVDWSATELVCAMQAYEGGPMKWRRGVRRRRASVEELLQWCRDLVGLEVVMHAVIEEGAEGWVQLLHAAGFVVHVANNAKVAAFAASLCSSGAKDDDRDAVVLGAFGRSAQHRPVAWSPEGDEERELQELSGLHDTLTADCVGWEQRLRAVMREQFPALEAVIGDLSRAWVCQLLREVPTAWHASVLTDEAISELLDRCHVRAKQRPVVREALHEARTTWLSERTARAIAGKVLIYIDHIERTTAELVEVDGRLDAATRVFPMRAHLEAVGGIGPRMANRVLRFALRDAPTDRDEAAVLLGAAPVFKGSARTPKGTPKGRAVMRKSVSAYARSTTYLLGRLATQQLQWAKAMYRDARARAQTAAHAYRRVARCLLRILSAIARTGEPYDEVRYINGLKQKDVPWARSIELPAGADQGRGGLSGSSLVVEG